MATVAPVSATRNTMAAVSAALNLTHNQEPYPEKEKELEALADVARKDLGDNLTKSPGANRRPSGSLK